MTIKMNKKEIIALIGKEIENLNVYSSEEDLEAQYNILKGKLSIIKQIGIIDNTEWAICSLALDCMYESIWCNKRKED